MKDEFKIELFIFPDGTAIEMIVFDDQAATGGAPTSRHDNEPLEAGEGAAPAPDAQAASTDSAAPARPHVDEDVNACPVCHSELVYPIDWQRDGEGSWSLRLRCPDCEIERNVMLGRAGVEELNRRLYHAAQQITREAEEMSRRNFEEEAAKLIAALELDLILPMDF